MKRTMVAMIATCAVLLVPTVANAAKTRYKGDIAPAGKLSFTLKEKKSTGAKSVIKLVWKGLPVSCKGGDQTSDGGLTYAVPVKQRSFKARAVLGDNAHPDARAVIKGKFKGKNASGTIEVSGTKLPTNDDSTGNCQSDGPLSWKARS